MTISNYASIKWLYEFNKVVRDHKTLTHDTEKNMQSFKMNHCASSERQRGNDLLDNADAGLFVCLKVGGNLNNIQCF